MRRSLIAVCCGALLSVGTFAGATTIKSLVKVKKLTSKQITNLVNAGYDVAKEGKGYAEMVLSKDEMDTFLNKGHPLEILIPDVDQYVSDIQKKQTKNAQYYTFKTMQIQLQKWAKDHADICKLESLGQSWEKRDIWGLKISDNPNVDENEPSALIMGDHHAREWPSVEVPMATAKELLENYDRDEKVKWLVDNREIWFVPMVNPDGMTYSQEKSRMWRKNRRDNKDGRFGVDPNRNWGYQWGNVGSSNSTYSDTYHGPHAFSEPEVCAVRDLAIREKFNASISCHTYSELILYPFGYAYNVPNPDQKIFKKMAGDMSRFNGYTPQNSAELYPAMGDSDDYLYGELKTLAFTFELCSTFIPSPSQIDDFCGDNVPAVMYLLEKAGTYGVIATVGNEDIIGQLDFNSAIGAVEDAQALFDNDDHMKIRNDVLDKVESVSKRIADLVTIDLKNGNTDTFERVKKSGVAGLALSFIKNRVLFESAHGDAFSDEILQQINRL